MPDEGLPLKEIGSVIPTVYYDLIARVSAGAPFVIFLVYSNHTKMAEMDQLVGKAGILLLILLGGYLVGMLLTPISGIFELPFLWFSRGVLNLKQYSFTEGIYQQAKRMGIVFASDKESGITVAKMAAEAVLFQNLCTGFLIMLGLRCVHWVDFPLSSAMGAVLLLMLLIAIVHRRLVHIGSQKAFYEIWQESQANSSAGKMTTPKP
jgi:hypothetical protein